MLVLIGVIVVFASVLGGFTLSKGHLLALFQPYEWIVICGAAFGAFLISNTGGTVVQTFLRTPGLILPSRFNKMLFLELLSCLYELFARMRRDGLISIEDDIENPQGSETFLKYPLVTKDPHVVEFITDYLRLMVIGDMSAFELENLMDIEIETKTIESEGPSSALAHVAEGLPGFGIVAAVLGIVITMQFLDGDPKELGHHIAAALVGTLTGILLAYGFIGPMSHALEHRVQEEMKIYQCIKVSILATLNGVPPQVAVEFGRKTLFDKERPSFQELEQRVRSR